MFWQIKRMKSIQSNYDEFVGNGNIAPLGNISTNSEVHLLFLPKRIWGERPKEWTDIVFWSGKGIQFDYTCHLKFHSFERFDKKLLFQRSLEE